MKRSLDGYTLLDSGNGRKLERYGDRIIDRPSSMSGWQQRSSAPLWSSAHATFTPPDQWSFTGKRFERWEAEIAGVQLELALMSNGQLGIFPEHALYLPRLGETLDALAKSHARPLKVLNLFAYTGLATCYCARRPGIQVTHVDLSKRAIEWAKRNGEINKLPQEGVRWIVDDALAFMAREHRKANTYDVIIIDPPSFSRISKNNSWTLEEKVGEIVSLFLNVLNRDAGSVFFTNHSTASTVDIARNMALDFFSDESVSAEIESLALSEEKTKRVLPAGSLIVLSHGIS